MAESKKVEVKLSFVYDGSPQDPFKVIADRAQATDRLIAQAARSMGGSSQQAGGVIEQSSVRGAQALAKVQDAASFGASTLTRYGQAAEGAGAAHGKMAGQLSDPFEKVARSAKVAEQAITQLARAPKALSEKDLEVMSRFDNGLKRLARSNLDYALTVQKAIDAEKQSLVVRAQLERRGLGQKPGGAAQASGGGGLSPAAQGGLIIQTGKDLASITGDVSNLIGLFKDMSQWGPQADGSPSKWDPRKSRVDSSRGLISPMIGQIGRDLMHTRAASMGGDSPESKLLMERDSGHRLEIRQPFRERQRALSEQYGVSQTEIDKINPYAAQRALSDRGIGYQVQRVQEATADNPRLEKMGKVYQEMATLQMKIAQEGKGTAETQIEIMRSAEGVTRAKAAEKELQKELETLEAAGDVTMAQRKSYQDQMSAAKERTLQAEQRQVDAIKAGGQAEVERQSKWRDWAADQKRHYQDIVRSEQERFRSLEEQYGQMDAMTRLATRQSVGLATKAGFGALTREQQDLARPFIGEQAQAYGRQIAQREGFDQMLAQNPYAVRKQQEAEKAVQLLANVQVAMENKVTAEIKINEKSLSDAIGNNVMPKIIQAITQNNTDMLAEVARQLELLKLNRQVSMSVR